MNSRLKRNQEIVNKLKAGVSVAAIMEEYGLTRNAVKAIARAAGVEIKRRETGGWSVKDQPVLSPLHKAIGFKQSVFRDVEKQFDRIEFSALTRIPASKVYASEQGKYDYTLSQLQRLAELMGITLAELLKDPQEDVLVKQEE